MKTFIITALIATCMGTISCNNSSNSDNSKPDDAPTAKSTITGQKVYYICPMDTEVISDHVGKCSKCGMDLEKKTMPDTIKVTVK